MVPDEGLRAGDVLAPYVIEKRIGAGGAAVVYRARHQVLHSLHALKVLHSDNPAMHRRTVLEGRIQGSLDHPHVVRVTDVLDHDGRVVLVMELVDGPDLHAWIGSQGSPPQVAETVFRQIVGGVGAAHARGILHRDLKPANILVASGPLAKVTDFGLGRMEGNERLTRVGTRLGTPAYMSPEQLRAGAIDQRADIWALGCILYELLTGRRAFPQSPDELARAVLGGVIEPLPLAIPSHLREAVRACLDLDPDSRPQSCEALTALLDGNPWRGADAPESPQVAGKLTWNDAGSVGPSTPDRTPGSIGEFSIIGCLGSGGMGVVWEAEQAHPRRRVALKTLHADNISPRARERFRFEAEALGQLKHPAIPRVYSAGEDQGMLYLVMEKVEGVPLDRWFATNRPSTDAAVRIFVELCAAVHYAHLRGFVHRDLKPENVLMTDAGEARVLDFGIAQAIGVDGAAAVLGTPAYMAPEQLRGETVDVRADVYALGVVIYELWGGRLPVDPAKGLAELMNPAPIPALGSLNPACRGDLEAIVARELQRHRELRYASVEALADDLRRHLAHRPVAARSPTPRYILGRWLCRNWAAAASVGAVILALSSGLGLAWSSYLEAEQAYAEEQRQRLAVEAQRERAERERESAEATTQFLSELLMQAHPDKALGRDLTIREALASAQAMLDEGHVIKEPLVEARLRLQLAEVIGGLGERDGARLQIEKAYELAANEPPSLTRAEAQMILAAITSMKDPVQGTEMARSALQALAEVEHLTDADRAVVKLRYMRVLRNAGDIEGALSGYRSLLAIDDLDPDLRANLLGQFAGVLLDTGAHGEAIRVLEETLSFERARHGDRHPRVAKCAGPAGLGQSADGRPTGTPPPSGCA